jgi:hypothetical protein
MYQALGWMLVGFFVTLLVGGACFYGYLLWEDRQALKSRRRHPDCMKCKGYPLVWIDDDDLWRRGCCYLCEDHKSRWAQMKRLERQQLDTEWRPGEWK